MKSKKKCCLYSLLSIFIINASLIIHAFASNNQGPKNIYIAVAAPMSGPKEKKGLEILEPIKLYVKILNSKGGVKGKQIKLLVFDDRNKVEPGSSWRNSRNLLHH